MANNPGFGVATAGGLMEAKQSRVLERLQAREDARKAQLVQRQEESLTTEASTESAAAFLQQFTAEARSLQRDIEIYRAAGNSTKQGANASTDIQLLNDRLGRLEESLSLASYYLLQYDVRQCLERTKILKELLYEAKEARQPRKKFSFSGKAISSIENASLAQEPPRNLSLQANVALQPKGRVISDLRATNVLVKGEELTEMDDVTINDLQECCIYILGPISALYVHQVQKCTIVTGPVVGACYIEGTPLWNSLFFMTCCVLMQNV